MEDEPQPEAPAPEPQASHIPGMLTTEQAVGNREDLD